MSLKLPSDAWLEIPAGKYRIGLEPQEARKLAEESAAWTKKQGVDLSPNEGKMIAKAATMLDTTANPKWVEQYLLAHYPARDVDIPAFAIARKPVTNRQYKQFMAETGERQPPTSWSQDLDNATDDELPADGLPWTIARDFAAWAGARLPFEHEWERAARGRDRKLFPWGNDFGPLGAKVISSGFPKRLPISTTRTADGFEGALCRNDEWCADVFKPNVDEAKWGDEPSPAWARVVRGGSGFDRVLPSGAFRGFGDPFRYSHDTGSIRLVRADGRSIPGPPSSTPRNVLALAEARAFEGKVLLQAFEKLRSSPIAEQHTIEVDWAGHFMKHPGAARLARDARQNINGVRTGILENTKAWVYGYNFVATSRESMRRIPKEHGVFLWNAQYRLGEDGHLRAKAVVVYRMAFDKGIHRFENRFRASEADTPVSAITPEMVRACILDAFQFYELHADADENPFPNKKN